MDRYPGERFRIFIFSVGLTPSNQPVIVTIVTALEDISALFSLSFPSNSLLVPNTFSPRPTAAAQRETVAF